MEGKEVFEALKEIGATHLHHTNSVTTSCTFLEEGGLLSRGFVESNHLVQTGQSSDGIDKKYGIWDRIFVDHVDIHFRGGRTKGPNQYGPVLFRFDLGILLELPADSDVLVTKSNPVHWYEKQPDAERWFQSVHELDEKLHFGDFDKMLVIKTPSQKLDFPKRRAEIFLDDPQRQVSSGESAYAYAEKRLRAAAKVGQIEISIHGHECRLDCICVEKYATYNSERVDFWFT